VATRWQGVFLSAILLLPLCLIDAQIGSKTSFFTATEATPTKVFSIYPKLHFGIYEKGRLGASLIGTKKRGFVQPSATKSRIRLGGLGELHKKV
jgi:hypothetical protein